MATYETALMRNYYNGRTETLRSCTLDAIDWVKTYLDNSKTVSISTKLVLNIKNKKTIK